MPVAAKSVQQKRFVAGSPLLTSSCEHWETPPDFFAELDAEFNFTLDPCCQVATAKCSKFYTPRQNGLLRSWANEVVFMNPPYGRAIGAWMAKAAHESRFRGATVVCLVPSRTGPRWWHDHVEAENAEYRFIPGRLRFWLNGRPGNKAPFDSVVVIYRPGR